MRRRRSHVSFQKLLRKLPHKSSLNFRRRRHKIEGEKVRSVGIWTAEITAVVVLALLLTMAFGMRMQSSGASMSPTIAENGSVFVNRLIYHLREPKVGDIVVFSPKSNTSAAYNVKRIIAGPGDTVLISNGRLYVNDEVVSLRGEDSEITNAGRAQTLLTLSEDEYFVLGDNVNHSEDSRYESIGNVTRSEIVGSAWFGLSIHSFGFLN